MAAKTEAHDTIYALSSGRPPAAIAVMRVSGPLADDAVRALSGRLPAARRATLALLHDDDGEPIDRGIVLRFPGPASVTGDDVAEFHVHGGVAVVAAMARALAALGLREAEAGEFTRRALLAGRTDTAAVDGLADLLAAETEAQRRDALRRAGGASSAHTHGWATRLQSLHAMAEAAIDYADDDVAADGEVRAAIATARDDIAAALARPSSERLRACCLPWMW